MKKVLMALIALGFAATVACAEWLVDFTGNYAGKGIDFAVEEAIKAGIAPDAIVEKGLALENLNPQNLVKALYCAGANGQDITAAASKYQISELIIEAGYKKSVEECGDKVDDTQAFTPTATAAPAFSGLPSSGGGGSFASPSTP